MEKVGKEVVGGRLAGRVNSKREDVGFEALEERVRAVERIVSALSKAGGFDDELRRRIVKGMILLRFSSSRVSCLKLPSLMIER